MFDGCCLRLVDVVCCMLSCVVSYLLACCLPLLFVAWGVSFIVSCVAVSRLMFVVRWLLLVVVSRCVCVVCCGWLSLRRWL